MQAIPYEERIRLSEAIPSDGQDAVMARIPQFAECVIHNDLATAPDTDGKIIKPLVFNMERGITMQATVDFLLHCPELKDVDIILANELDDGCVRSGCKQTALEIAKKLNMNFVFGLEFMELVNPDDPKGYHGNAIFSRWPITWAETLRLPEAYNWYFDNQRRIGGRLAIFAKIDVKGTEMGLVCVHLENRADGEGRALQMKAIYDEADRVFGKDMPVIIGGDCNTNTFDGGDVPAAIAMWEEQKRGDAPRNVASYEPLLPMAEEYGYDYRSCNCVNVPTRRKPMRPSGFLEMQLDWLFIRGVEAGEHAMVSTLKKDFLSWAPADSALAAFAEDQLSDHNAVWSVCRVK